MPKSINFLKFIIFFTKVFAILVLFRFGIWAIWEFPQQQVQPLKQEIDILKRSKADPKDIATQLKGRIEVENTARNGAIQAIGGLLVFVTLYISWQNFKVTEAKQVAERFSKAVEQLGSENIHTRLGGIYALEQIAKDAEEKYYRQVMETLTAYVREKSPFPSLESQEKTQGTEDIPRLPTDIQAVMTVLSRPKYSHNNGEDYRLDLRKTDLPGLQLLAGAKLQGVNFQEACLEKAILQEAKLQGAWFAKADLQGVNLSNAKLQEVDLRQTDLKEGKFKQANLQRADLSIANLQGAGISVTDTTAACHQFRSNLLSEYQVIDITENIINSAMALAEARGLRGYDAVQLAAGCAVNALSITNGLPPVNFVSADYELNKAAANEGLLIENPNNYPSKDDLLP